mmetsp:Transcript_11993/g.37964  ORF Transcript_11993/g.37964 Transcript_11993/m.37964 type:complete len:238 (+) Transcript_11993:885-1598(+)
MKRSHTRGSIAAARNTFQPFCFFRSPDAYSALYVPSGTSSDVRYSAMPTKKRSTAGTRTARRHARSKPKTMNHESTHGMNTCVKPPPRLPQPADVAFAVPTTFFENMTDVQNCVITNVAPIPPMKKRTAASDAPLLTAPASASGIEKSITMNACEKRGPYVSAHAPTSSRMPIVPATETVLALPIASLHRAPQMHSRGDEKSFQSPFSHRPSETRTIGVSGASANQPVNARKKESHA